MSKNLLIAVLTTVSSSTVIAGEYRTAQEVIDRWMILDTCVDYVEAEQKRDPKFDAKAELLKCANDAEKRLSTTHI
ncbi:hypothetical protein [Vibrio sp. THAF190c]|uniref:hypothetical protein n=1 Tax=Vibrio sp. THAF190c TaxID=2587865 RepID=UPI001268B21B|nr:hypothetical protein [Vibrio sp. THAF190c]QFT13372.1 hypothetical protein FIV04_25815 [Vibrio sp. THAF190c]